jgi:hypothetical protein
MGKEATGIKPETANGTRIECSVTKRPKTADKPSQCLFNRTILYGREVHVFIDHMKELYEKGTGALVPRFRVKTAAFQSIEKA